MQIKSYKQLQELLTDWCKVEPPVPIEDAPHGAFWETMSYSEFVNGNVPRVGPPRVKILISGDGRNSNIVQALQGTGMFGPGGDYPRMPPPPYRQMNHDLIEQIIEWIDAKCPEFAPPNPAPPKPFRPLYMAAIQDALKQGNRDELQSLLDQARTTVQQQGDLSQAIRDLENALKK